MAKNFFDMKDVSGFIIFHCGFPMSKCAKANVVLSISRTAYDRKITLEKHSYIPLGFAELPNESLTIADFVEANE